MRNIRSFLRTIAAASALVLVSVAGHAATIHLKADLNGPSEVPATTGAGTATLTATLDQESHELKYHVEFSGLTGAVVAAHFHGPAAAGEKGKPQVPVKASPITSPIDGTTTLTQEQARDLADGKWYFNLHTAANPGGEVRGQVVRVN